MQKKQVNLKKTQDDDDMEMGWCEGTPPERPYDECWNYDAWLYESDNEKCNIMWEDWDIHCDDCSDVGCSEVSEAVELLGWWDWLDAEEDWQDEYWVDEDDEDFFAEVDNWDYWLNMKKKGAKTHQIKKVLRTKKMTRKNIALLSAAQAQAPQEESTNYSGAVIGASVAVLGAAAAIFAAKKCNKKDNDFERQ